MSIIFRTEVKDGVLLVTSSGRDDSLEDVLHYGFSVIETAVSAGVTRVLCDERALEYTLGTTATYQAAQLIAERAPNVARVAIVCAPSFLEKGKFWETVAVNRHLHVRVDVDAERAMEWLKKGSPAAK
ncbi:MAG: hypothetical protein RBU37_25310 [Myxococcota bacterium]|jgi:hypothetical protein|nr:hypothetical protein [Myxococcota bacterium]